MSNHHIISDVWEWKACFQLIDGRERLNHYRFYDFAFCNHHQKVLLEGWIIPLIEYPKFNPRYLITKKHLQKLFLNILSSFQNQNSALSLYFWVQSRNHNNILRRSLWYIVQSYFVCDAHIVTYVLYLLKDFFLQAFIKNNWSLF